MKKLFTKTFLLLAFIKTLTFLQCSLNLPQPTPEIVALDIFSCKELTLFSDSIKSIESKIEHLSKEKSGSFPILHPSHFNYQDFVEGLHQKIVSQITEGMILSTMICNMLKDRCRDHDDAFILALLIGQQKITNTRKFFEIYGNEFIVASFSENEVQKIIENAKPILEKTMSFFSDFYFANLEKICQRFSEDVELIQEVFFPSSEKKDVQLIQIEIAKGEIHKSDGVTTILSVKGSNNNVKKIVYKPSSILLDFLVTGRVEEFCENKKHSYFAMICSQLKPDGKLFNHVHKKFQNKIQVSADSNNVQKNNPFRRLAQDPELSNNLRKSSSKIIDKKPFSPMSLFEILEFEKTTSIIETYHILPIENFNLAENERIAQTHGYSEFIESMNGEYSLTEAMKQLENDSKLDEILKKKGRQEEFEIQKVLDSDFNNWLVGQEPVLDIYFKGFWHDLGVAASVLFLLGSTDFHYENVIITNNKRLVLIDFEASLNWDDRLWEENDSRKEAIPSSIYTAFDSGTGGLHFSGPKIFLKLLYTKSREGRFFLTMTGQPTLSRIFPRQTKSECIPFHIDWFESGVNDVFDIYMKDKLRDWFSMEVLQELIIREISIATVEFLSICKYPVSAIEEQDWIKSRVGLFRKGLLQRNKLYKKKETTMNKETANKLIGGLIPSFYSIAKSKKLYTSEGHSVVDDTDEINGSIVPKAEFSHNLVELGENDARNYFQSPPIDFLRKRYSDFEETKEEFLKRTSQFVLQNICQDFETEEVMQKNPIGNQSKSGFWKKIGTIKNATKKILKSIF